MFIGIQASGKSTFYKNNFFNTHLRISNDLLKTKNREKLLMEFCFGTRMPFVIDNTNPTREVRGKYTGLIKQAGFKLRGFYFRTDLKQSLERNKTREGKECIPEAGILAVYKRLELPSPSEGFDELYYVDILNGNFVIKEWEE